MVNDHISLKNSASNLADFCPTLEEFGHLGVIPPSNHDSRVRARREVTITCPDITKKGLATPNVLAWIWVIKLMLQRRTKPIPAVPSKETHYPGLMSLRHFKKNRHGSKMRLFKRITEFRLTKLLMCSLVFNPHLKSEKALWLCLNIGKIMPSSMVGLQPAKLLKSNSYRLEGVACHSML
jgi:hypothetical protein